MNRTTSYAAVALAALLVTACSSGPPVPDWQVSAQSAVERATAAYMGGNSVIEQAEYQRARAQLASTGRVELVLQAELVRCAARVAALVFEECSGFEALRMDAGPAQRAYAEYLAGRPVTASTLLPLPQQAVAAAASETAAATALQAIADPLSQLVAAGVLMRKGQATPAVLATAVSAASTQGWRRPLLAWLGVQMMRAEQAGDQAEVQRLKRRMALVSETTGGKS